MEIVKFRCKCGWEGAVRKGKIVAIYCPICKNLLKLEKPKIKKRTKKKVKRG